jgi:deazaflavin-dependent oxidoreductase (nitroreductase family)
LQSPSAFSFAADFSTSRCSVAGIPRCAVTLNLLANPAVEVQVGKDQFPARARVVTGKERAQIWEQMVKIYPFYGEYQKKTKREIPVVALEKQPAST